MNLNDKLKNRYSKLFLSYELPEPFIDKRFISENIIKEILAEEILLPPIHKKNILPTEMCTEIIDFFESSEQLHRTYQGVINKNFRDSLYVKLPLKHKNIIYSIIKDCLKQDFHKELSTEFETEILVYKYPKGIGFDSHHDLITKDEYNRSLENNTPIIPGDYSFVFFLNTLTEQQGGELIFPEFKNVIFPATEGSMVAFRVDYVHKVSPIVFGNRYSMPVRIFINQ